MVSSCSFHILCHLVLFFFFLFSFSHGFSPSFSSFKSYFAIFILFACLSPPLLIFLLMSLSLFQTSFQTNLTFLHDASHTSKSLLFYPFPSKCFLSLLFSQRKTLDSKPLAYAQSAELQLPFSRSFQLFTNIPRAATQLRRCGSSQ